MKPKPRIGANYGANTHEHKSLFYFRALFVLIRGSCSYGFVVYKSPYYFAAFVVVLTLFYGSIAGAVEGTATAGPAPAGGGAAGDFFNALTNFYSLGLSLVGISALLVMVWGGVYIVIAGDNSSFLEKGKSKIKSALYGILIAAFSYALLYTINPDLVQLRITPLPSVAPVDDAGQQ